MTHIAPDTDGKIIGEPVTQRGVINYPVKSLGLCASITDAPYVTTTEVSLGLSFFLYTYGQLDWRRVLLQVYPDSPSCTDDECNEAQVACVVAALTHVKRVEKL